MVLSRNGEAVCRCMFQASHSQPYFLSLPAATNFFSRVMFVCGFALFDLFFLSAKNKPLKVLKSLVFPVTLLLVIPCLCSLLPPHHIDMISAAVLFWCDHCWLLIILLCSFCLSCLIHMTSNPYIFSLLPSSWINVATRLPHLPKSSLFFSVSLSLPIHLLSQSPSPPTNAPVPPPPSHPPHLLISSSVSHPLSSSPCWSTPPFLQDFWQVWGVCRVACVELNEKLHCFTPPFLQII